MNMHDTQLIQILALGARDDWHKMCIAPQGLSVAIRLFHAVFTANMLSFLAQ